MVVKPIKPSEVADTKAKVFPDYVLEAVNTLIARRFTNGRALFTQDEVITTAFKLSERGADPDRSVTIEPFRQYMFKNGYLNFEEIYREQGWIVEYDKPGYNETYSANFKFTVPRR